MFKYFLILSILWVATVVSWAQEKNEVSKAIAKEEVDLDNSSEKEKTVETLTLPLSERSALDRSTPWNIVSSYDFSADLAEARESRAWNHRATGRVGYYVLPQWEVGGLVQARASFIDGQVSKGPEETRGETLSPFVSVGTSWRDRLIGDHYWSVFIGYGFLLDEASRLEGYKGLPTLNGSVNLRFFDGRYLMGHQLSSQAVINTYPESLKAGTANPDYSVSYGLNNTLRIYGNWTGTAAFGVRATRYIDDFVGYTYNNTLSLAYSASNWSASLDYINGGYVDDGRVELWFIDRYRRIVGTSWSYRF